MSEKGKELDQSQDVTFGKAVVELGYSTRDRVDECLGIQEKMREMGVVPKKLGEIMVEKKYISADQRATILRRLVRDYRHIIPGYELTAKIGQGGMGAVYRARQLSMDRTVAMKVLAPKLAGDKEYIERFLREARAAAKLNHKNIIAGIDVGEANGVYYFVMEYVEGETLSNILRKFGALSESTALDIVREIACALEHARENAMVHRDVKPDNIMITATGTAKLCDLGLAKEVTCEGSLTMSGTVMGSPWYISPEQARGDAAVDIRSDIYSLGITLYHMLAGDVPFRATSAAVIMTKHINDPLPDIGVLRSDVSQDCCDLVEKMTAKELDRRHQTPAELVRHIDEIRRDAGRKSGGASAKALGAGIGWVELEDRRALVGSVVSSGRASQSADTDVPIITSGKSVVAGKRKPGRRMSPGQPRQRRKFPDILYPAAAVLLSAIGIGAYFLFFSGRVSSDSKKEESVGRSDEAALPAEGGVSGDVSIDDEVRENLADEALRAAMDHARRNPKAIKEVFKELEAVMTEYPGTKAAEEAESFLESIKMKAEERAQTLVTKLKMEAERLIGLGRLYDAQKVFDKFPEELDWTLAAQEAKAYVERTAKEIGERFEEDRKKAEELEAMGKYSEAIRLMEEVGAYAPSVVAGESRTIIARLKEAEERYERLRAVLLKWYSEEFFPLYVTLMKKARYADAEVHARAAIENSDYAVIEDLLREDAKNAALMVSFRRRVVEGLAAYQGKNLSELGFSSPVLKGDMGKCIRMKDEKPYVLLKAGGEMGVEVDLLDASDRVRLAIEAMPESGRDSAETHLASGLAYFFWDDVERASSEFIAAAARGDSSAERYLDCLYGDAPIDEGSREEVEKTGEQVFEPRPPDTDSAKKIVALFKGKAEAHEDGVVEVHYDFSSEEQLSDWRLDPGEAWNWKWNKKRGNAVLRGSLVRVAWKASVSESVEMELSFRCRNIENFSIRVMDSERGEHYGFVVNQKENAIPGLDPVDIVTGKGSDIGRAVKKIRLGEVTSDKWHRVRVSRDGKSMRFYFDKELVCQAEDDLYHEGEVVLHVSGCFTAIEIDDLRIKAKLSGWWISQNVEH